MFAATGRDGIEHLARRFRTIRQIFPAIFCKHVLESKFARMFKRTPTSLESFINSISSISRLTKFSTFYFAEIASNLPGEKRAIRGIPECFSIYFLRALERKRFLQFRNWTGTPRERVRVELDAIRRRQPPRSGGTIENEYRGQKRQSSSDRMDFVASTSDYPLTDLRMRQ